MGKADASAVIHSFAAVRALLLSINFVTAPGHIENESGLPTTLDFPA